MVANNLSNIFQRKKCFRWIEI